MAGPANSQNAKHSVSWRCGSLGAALAGLPLPASTAAPGGGELRRAGHGGGGGGGVNGIGGEVSDGYGADGGDECPLWIAGGDRLH